jgi:hypothetical protein
MDLTCGNGRFIRLSTYLEEMPDGTSKVASRGQKHHYIPKFYLKQWIGPCSA